MKTVTAYACGRTGHIFKTMGAAARHEFHERLADVAKSLPSPNVNNMHTFYDAFLELGNRLDGGTYGVAFLQLQTALQFLADHYEVITGKPLPPLTLDDAVDPGSPAPMTRLTIDTDDEKLFNLYAQATDFDIPFNGPLGLKWITVGKVERTGRSPRYQIVLARVSPPNIAEPTA